MNRKQLILVLLALAVLGGAGLVLLHQNQKSWDTHEAKMGGKVLPDFNINEVAAIHIKGKADLNVAHTNGHWVVRERGDYPANYQRVRELLFKAQEIKVVQSEQIGASQLAQLELGVPGSGADSGMLVEFKNAQGKVLDALLVGKQHLKPQNGSDPFNLHGLFDGRYVQLPGDRDNVLLVSDELASVSADPQPWLDHDFFKPENMQFVSLISPNPTDSWELLRESASLPWTLNNGSPDETLDALQATQLVERLNFLRFADVIADPGPSVTGLDKPMIMTITTFDHFAYTLKIGFKAPGGNYFTSMSVSASIPKERVAGKDETPEVAKKLDGEFADKTKKLQEKLAKEQALAAWVYLMDSPSLEQFVRPRSQLVHKAEPSAIAK